jgi:hypothetical protein
MTATTAEIQELSVTRLRVTEVTVSARSRNRTAPIERLHNDRMATTFGVALQINSCSIHDPRTGSIPY